MKRRKSNILPVPGRRGAVGYEGSRQRQKDQEKIDRMVEKLNQVSRDYATGRRDGTYDGSGGSRIMPMFRDDE